MSAQRLFELLYVLLERGHVTAPELAQRFEVSVRTIYRDIDALSSAGIPIYAAPGRKGGIALLDGYVLDRALFTPEEQRQLLTALRALPELPGQDSALICAMLAALFRTEEPDWLQVDLSSWGAAESDGHTFEQLRQAIVHKHPVTFTYAGSSGTPQLRRVLPARLSFKGRAWYLQCFCLDRLAYRTFKLGRLLELQVSTETFSQILTPPPLAFDETEATPFCVPLRLRFAPWMAHRVYDEFDSSVIHREPDGAFLVCVTFPEDMWLYGYLLSFGAGVEVLDPPGIRTRLGLLAKEIWLGTLEPDTGCQGFCAKMDPVPEPNTIQEVPTMNDTFCQSCGMPLTDELLGTERDGSKSPYYCRYCYENGAFTGEMTMEEMIEFCVPHMVSAHPDLSPEQARAQMAQFFPMLMRWRKG